MMTKRTAIQLIPVLRSSMCLCSFRVFIPTGYFSRGNLVEPPAVPFFGGWEPFCAPPRILLASEAQGLRCGSQKAAQGLCLHGLPVAGIQAVCDIGVNAQPSGCALDALQRVSRPADRLLRLLHCVLQVGAGEHLRRGRYDLFEIHSPSAPLLGPIGP